MNAQIAVEMKAKETIDKQDLLIKDIEEKLEVAKLKLELQRSATNDWVRLN